MKYNLQTIVIYFVMMIMLNACALTGKQFRLLSANQSNKVINYEINSDSINDSVYIKQPIGFAGIAEELIQENNGKMDGALNSFQPVSKELNEYKNREIDTVGVGIKPVTDPLLIAGICSVVVGFVSSPILGPAGSLLMLAGIGLIIASLIRIKNHPEKYKGKNLAIISLVVIGALFILLVVAVLAFIGLFGF